MSASRASQTVLFLLIFYFVYTDVLLSPFYPQFFEKAFGITDLEYTAFYILIARLTVVIALPMWGYLSKYFEVKHLLYVGQGISAVMLAGMAGAQHAQAFLWFTIFLLIGKSSYFLIYPLLIELNGEAKRSAVVGVYHTIFHGAIMLGTVSGAWMIKLENPLLLFYGLAALEAVLSIISCIVLRKLSSREKTFSKSHSADFSRMHVSFLAAIGLVIFAFHTANNMIRPYFTMYTINDFQLSLVESSVLFMIPSLMAMIAFRPIRKICSPEKLRIVFVMALTVLAVTLILQGITSSFILLCMSRVCYGFFLAIAQAALEMYLFTKSNNQLQINYTIASSFQNAGLLAAPMLASMSVISYSLAAPFVIAGAICLMTLLVARMTIFKEQKTAIQEAVVVNERAG
jgi:MFS family permease